MNRAGCGEHQSHSNASEDRLLRSAPHAYPVFPAVLAGLFGAGVLETAYADGDEVCVN
jgi:hypothetical protein